MGSLDVGLRIRERTVLVFLSNLLCEVFNCLQKLATSHALPITASAYSVDRYRTSFGIFAIPIITVFHSSISGKPGFTKHKRTIKLICSKLTIFQMSRIITIYYKKNTSRSN